MTEIVEPSYIMLDPRPTAAETPCAFFLPSDVELAAVANGDYVKLTFEYQHQTEIWAAERAWVIVEAADRDVLYGTLGNSPTEPSSPL